MSGTLDGMEISWGTDSSYEHCSVVLINGLYGINHHIVKIHGEENEIQTDGTNAMGIYSYSVFGF